MRARLDRQKKRSRSGSLKRSSYSSKAPKAPKVPKVTGFLCAISCNTNMIANPSELTTRVVGQDAPQVRKPSTHPVRGDELRALRKLKREAPKSPFVFVSERGGPFTTDSFNWLVKRAGRNARLEFQVHAHMLRHAAGFKLAGDGRDTRSIQDYLGHKNIQHTVVYTELSPTRFKNFWRD